MVGQMRWLLWPSTIRAAYLLGGAGEEQLNRQAATKPVTKGLKLMVTVRIYHGGRNRATGVPINRATRPIARRHELGNLELGGSRIGEFDSCGRSKLCTSHAVAASGTQAGGLSLSQWRTDRRNGRLFQLGARRPIWHELACLVLPGSVFTQVKPGRPTAAFAPVARTSWCSGLASVQRCGRSAVGAKRAAADTAVLARQLPPGLASTRRRAVGDWLRREVPPESTPPVVPEARARDRASQPGRRSGRVVNPAEIPRDF